MFSTCIALKCLFKHAILVLPPFGCKNGTLYHFVSGLPHLPSTAQLVRQNMNQFAKTGNQLAKGEKILPFK